MVWVSKENFTISGNQLHSGHIGTLPVQRRNSKMGSRLITLQKVTQTCMY